MTLDVATVQAITVLPFALMAGFLAWTWWAQRSSPALVWWSLAFAFAAGTALTTWFDPGHTNHVNVFVDDVLFLLAHVTLLGGFRAFIGGRPPWRMAVAVLAAYTAFAFIVHLPPREVVRVAVALASLLTLLAIVDFARWQERRLVWRGLVTGVLAVHLAVLVTRAATGPAGETVGSSTTEEVLQAIFLIAPILNPIALGYTMLGMVYERRTVALQSAALRDPLTGALNRRGVDEWLAFERQTPSEGRRDGDRAALAAIAVDVDHFKVINDTHGHAVGDAVLTAMVERLSAEMRPGDAIARFGGEEFLVLMPRITPRDALTAAERMRHALLRAPVKAAGRDVPITASFGVALEATLPHADAMPDLLDRADGALYSAKRSGRNRVVAADTVPAAA